MKNYIIMIIGIALVGIFIMNNQIIKKDTGGNKLLDKVINNEISAKEVVEEFAINSSDTIELAASVNSEEVTIQKGQREFSVALSDDQFYLAVAPYIDTTHPCTVHNLTTCQGELTNKEILVNVVTDDGKQIINKTMTTLDNGFVELWLPRYITGKLKITYRGKEAEEDISTFENDPTCLTTMQLK